MAEFAPFTDWLAEQNWIGKGDCVYVVSDMLELAKAYREQGIRLDLNNLIDGIQQIVGKEGTLLFPTFNWDFCKGVGFDSHSTPVRTGALSKTALARKDFDRTAHPLYSFAVWGMHREELLANTSVDSFGPGTIFESLYKWKGKILSIGLPALQGASYIHHVEQMVGVPYRYQKEFTADYMNEAGVYERRTYRMYVRDLAMDPRHIDGFRPLEEQMRNQGKLRTEFYRNTVPCHVMQIMDLDEAVRKDILENDSRNMYVYRHTKSN